MKGRSREFALTLLQEIQRGKKSSSAIDHLLQLQKDLRSEDRALITEFIYGVLRWQGKLDTLIERFSKVSHQKISPLILDVLRLGVYQLLFLDRIPEYAAIYETVSLAKKSGEKRASGFVNAVLRNVQKQKRSILEESQNFLKVGKLSSKNISFELSHPKWLVKLWASEFGLEKALKICQFNNTIAPLTLRVNTMKITREEMLSKMGESTSYSPFGVLIAGGALRELSGFQEGYFQVQDEASQLVGLAVAPKEGERILDVCAAPGGKTTHLAELMKDRGEVIAIDRDEKRVSQLKENLQRLGLKSTQVIQADFLKFDSEKLFDRILVDAPCSSLGVLRRRPEAKWNKKESQILEFPRLQFNLLKKALSLLKPGGVLVYSVCTFTAEETKEVVDLFLEKNSSVNLDTLVSYLPKSCEKFIKKEGFFLVLPGESSMDGFFISRFIKEK